MRDLPKTDPELLDRLVEAARNYKMTPTEIRAQRVSFVYGQLGGDHNSPLTREQVRQQMAEREGWND